MSKKNVENGKPSNNGASCSNNGNHMKSQTRNKQKCKSTCNDDWSDPWKRTFLPCNHFITARESHKQALASGCVSIYCVKCGTKFPISVLEEHSPETDSVEKPSFNKNDNNKHSDAGRNCNRSYINYDENNYKSDNNRHSRQQSENSNGYPVPKTHGPKSSNSYDRGNVISQNKNVIPKGCGYKCNKKFKNPVLYHESYNNFGINSRLDNSARNVSREAIKKLPPPPIDQLIKTKMAGVETPISVLKEGASSKIIPVFAKGMQNLDAYENKEIPDESGSRDQDSQSIRQSTDFYNYPGNIKSEMASNVTNNVNVRPIPALRHTLLNGKSLDNLSNASSDLMNYKIINADTDNSHYKTGAISKDNITYANSEKASDLSSRFCSVSDELHLLVCVSCIKLIPQKNCEYHKDHKLMNLDEGTNVLWNRKLIDINSMASDVRNKLLENCRHNSRVEDSINILPDVYNVFKAEQLRPDSWKEKGNEILCQIEKIEQDGKSVTSNRPASFIDVQNLMHTEQDKMNNVENWVEDANNMPLLRLIPSWLKFSVAILLTNPIGEGKDIFVIKGNEIARLSILGDCYLLSPFFKNVTTTDDAYLIKYELVENIFSEKSPLAFMKISFDDEEPSEPIMIRINTTTFWGKQFQMMCTSESGQSFLGTTFFRNCWNGQEGHHIWGGDFTNNDGSGGHVVLQDKDISLKTPPLPLIEGMIAARFGYEDRSTIFRIYLKGTKSPFIEECAFAQIEEGLDILQCAAMKGDITKVIISDIGIAARL